VVELARPALGPLWHPHHKQGKPQAGEWDESMKVTQLPRDVGVDARTLGDDFPLQMPAG
jgi:hypothetical protein